MKYKLRSSNWFDKLIYRLFMWRWNPIFKDDPLLAHKFSKYIVDWTRKNYSRELNNEIEKYLREEERDRILKYNFEVSDEK